MNGSPSMKGTNLPLFPQLENMFAISLCYAAILNEKQDKQKLATYWDDDLTCCENGRHTFLFT